MCVRLFGGDGASRPSAVRQCWRAADPLASFVEPRSVWKGEATKPPTDLGNSDWLRQTVKRNLIGLDSSGHASQFDDPDWTEEGKQTKAFVETIQRFKRNELGDGLCMNQFLMSLSCELTLQHNICSVSKTLCVKSDTVLCCLSGARQRLTYIEGSCQFSDHVGPASTSESLFRSSSLISPSAT